MFTATCASYTYTMRQMGQRDATVIKSVIRLLQGKTRHSWRHCEGGLADLVLIGNQPDVSQLDFDLISGQQAVIHVNSAGNRDANALAWPIRTDEFLRHLDDAGEHLARRNRTRPVDLPAILPEVQLASESVSRVALTQHLSLLRWPDAALLQRDARYTKLATLLTGRPVNLMEIAARSACPLDVCQQFADLMNTAGFLRAVEPSALAQAAATAAPQRPSKIGSTRYISHAPRGLVARIRQRLGLIGGSPADRQARP